MVAASLASGGARAVFLDRDGVLVRPEFRDGRSFAPTTIEAFEIVLEAKTCLPRLKQAGYRLIVVTNQPDVGAGRVARQVVSDMHDLLFGALPVDVIKVCFHTREARCACRKPSPGMILEAARENAIDLGASVMVGDRASDIDAGTAAGCRTAFIDLGYISEAPPVYADLFAASLSEVTDWILRTGKPT